MRICDWSSDVCSSDLATFGDATQSTRERILYDCRYWTAENGQVSVSVEVFAYPTDTLAQMEDKHRSFDDGLLSEGLHPLTEIGGLGDKAYSFVPDRKSVVQGKSGSVRVELGGR